MIILIENVNIQKKVFYDFFGVINLVGLIEYVLMRYEYKDKKVNIFGDKIININISYTLF